MALSLHCKDREFHPSFDAFPNLIRHYLLQNHYNFTDYYSVVIF